MDALRTKIETIKIRLENRMQQLQQYMKEYAEEGKRNEFDVCNIKFNQLNLVLIQLEEALSDAN